MTRYWHPSGRWDKLRPLNKGMVRDVELLYEWDLEHPGRFAWYPGLCIAAAVQETGEIAKLSRWKLAEWSGTSYEKDGNRSSYYRILEDGKSFCRGEISIPYESWDSDGALNHLSPQVFIHQVRDGFDLRTVREYHQRYMQREPPENNPGSPVAPPGPPPQPTPPPPVSSSKSPDEIREMLRHRHGRG